MTKTVIGTLSTPQTLERKMTEKTLIEIFDETFHGYDPKASYNEVIDSSLKAVIAAYESRKWQSVTNAPEECQAYLGYGDWGIVNVCFGYALDENDGIARFDNWVTHWQPLPAPPKQESES